MIKNQNTPVLTWKLSLAMGVITLTVLAAGFVARPWFQETPRKNTPNRLLPQPYRSIPTPRDNQPTTPVDDANPPARMPHVDDLFTPPKKGILKR
jgi:hypothetical protein